MKNKDFPIMHKACFECMRYGRHQKVDIKRMRKIEEILNEFRKFLNWLVKSQPTTFFSFGIKFILKNIFSFCFYFFSALNIRKFAICLQLMKYLVVITITFIYRMANGKGNCDIPAGIYIQMRMA